MLEKSQLQRIESTRHVKCSHTHRNTNLRSYSQRDVPNACTQHALPHLFDGLLTISLPRGVLLLQLVELGLVDVTLVRRRSAVLLGEVAELVLVVVESGLVAALKR